MCTPQSEFVRCIWNGNTVKPIPEWSVDVDVLIVVSRVIQPVHLLGLQRQRERERERDV